MPEYNDNFEVERIITALRNWLAESGITGVRVNATSFTANDVTDELHVAAATELEFDLTFGQESRLHKLLHGVFHRFLWCDLVEIEVVPVRDRNAHVVLLQLVWMNPMRSLSEASLLSQAGWDDAEARMKAFADQIHSLVDAWASSSLASDPAQLWSDFGQWCSGATSDTQRDEDERRFLRKLPTGLRASAEDARLLSFLEQSRRRVLENVDEWANEGVRVSERPTGYSTQRAPWNPRLMRSWTTINEMGPPSDTPDRDAESLYELSIDPVESPTLRNSARTELFAMQPRLAGPWPIRVLGHELDRWNSLTQLCRREELQPLFRELAFCDPPDGVTSVLDQLMAYGERFQDPLDAFAFATADPRGRVEAVRCQIHIAGNLTYGGGENVQALCSALRAATLGSAQRSTDWLHTVVLHISSAEPALFQEVAEAVAPYVTHAAKEVRRCALRFFHRVDHPPIWNALRAATFDDDEEVVHAACDGLGGQSGIESSALVDALRTAVRLTENKKASSASGYDIVGLYVLRELARRDEACDEDLIRRVVVHLPSHYLSDEVRRYAGLTTKQESSDELQSTESRSRRFDDGLKRWLEPSFVLEQYHRFGECDAAWDRDVEDGHGAYDISDYVKAGSAYDRAMQAGCADGMVIYRRGFITSHTDSEAAEILLVQAYDAISRTYPKCPYIVAAAEALGTLRQQAGDISNAMSWLSKTKSGSMESSTANAKLESLQQQYRAIAQPARASIEVGQLGGIGSNWHDAEVTGLALHSLRGDFVLASATEGGTVQLASVLVDGSFANPEARGILQAHAEGRTLIAWIGDTLVSAGSDAKLLRYELADLSLQARALASLPASITALSSWGSHAVACACADGSLIRVSMDGRFEVLHRTTGLPVIGFAERRGELLAVDDGSCLEFRDVDGSVRWSCTGAKQAVFDEEGKVLVATAIGSGFEVRDPRDGTVLASAKWARAEPDFIISPGPEASPILGWRSGTIQAGGVHLITGGLNLFTANSAMGVLAHANRQHKLGAGKI